MTDFVPLEPTELETLLGTRYSCRAFRPDPVDGALLDRLFAMAQRTPSWSNTQPWQVHLLSGEARARFGKGLTEYVLSHAPAADLGVPVYAGVHDERRREVGQALHEALGISRDDRAARQAQLMKNFNFFGAPHTAVITTATSMGAYGAIDCGGYVTTLMLGAQSLGLGAVAQGAVAMYSEYVRDWLDLPDDRQVVCAVSLGHPDPDDPVNSFRAGRVPVSDVVHHVG